MNKAKILTTNEIVMAETLLELYPNYKKIEFVCLDELCLFGWLLLALKRKITENLISRNTEMENTSKPANMLF